MTLLNLYLRHRRATLIASLIAMMCFVVWLFINWATTTRQSAVRAQKHNMLRAVAQAAEVYRSENGGQVSLDQLVTSGLIEREVRREFAKAEIIGEGNPSLVPIVVQKVPCREVRAGEAWGGLGEYSDRKLPARRYVLMSDWSVVGIDEPEYQEQWASRVRLVPLE